MGKKLARWAVCFTIVTLGIFLSFPPCIAGESEGRVEKTETLSRFSGTSDRVDEIGVSLPLRPWAKAHEDTSLKPFGEALLVSNAEKDFLSKLDLLRHGQKFGGIHSHQKNQPPAGAWRFLRRYPRQYVVHELGPGEKIDIDGRLDDQAWARTAWTKGRFVDITHHQDRRLNRVPKMFQTRAKLRWDNDFLYIGAELHEPVVYGTVTGHNSADGPPYCDNDFEVFIDVSGTTEYYKEYEMNVLNATYDVLWGVPDGLGLVCDKSADHSAMPYVPTCHNTTFPNIGPPHDWTMVGGPTGLKSATGYDLATFGEYVSGRSVWTLEIAFPIRGNTEHGGLLDAQGPFPTSQSNYRQYDPSLGDAGPGRPRYWYFDLARAERPRPYQFGSDVVYCPFGCPNSLAGMTPSFDQLTQDECQTVMDMWPTLLGTSPKFTCYWEFVWQDLGPEDYMHRPQSWALLQFTGARSETTKLCRNIEFPGRHIAKQVNAAQAQFLELNGTYATQARQLLHPKVCSPPTCLIGDLVYALSQPEIFSVNIRVEEKAKVLSPACTARPCYQASVHVAVPRTDGYAYTVHITNNRLVTVEHHDVPGEKAPCL